MGSCSSMSSAASDHSAYKHRVAEIEAENSALRAALAGNRVAQIPFSAESAHERVLKGFKRRDVGLQRHVFTAHAVSVNGGPSAISPEKLPGALADVFARVSNLGDKQPDPFPPPAAADFSEFQRYATALSPLERWLARLPLAQIIADAMPPEISALELDDGMMRALVDLPSDILLASLQAAVVGIAQAVSQEQAALRASLLQQRDGSAPLPSKFQLVKMSVGSITDFHRGLNDRIGAANLDFETTMRLEHCSKCGSNQEFEASNYRITTTPCKEWLYVVSRDNQMAHGRRIPSISALLQLPISVQSGLTRPEVIALVLYSGPMFVVYNSILRRFPSKTYSQFADGGNCFATTIFVLVSAVQKIATRTNLPPGTKLYRWGFLSTTADVDVAIKYSGIASDQPLPAIMVITPSSVDRGACIEQFSQYPSEKEFLYAPMSFLQPLGSSDDHYLIPASRGFVSAHAVRINSNLKSDTVEQLVSKKKDMHVTAFVAVVDEIANDLEAEAQSCNIEARLLRDRTRNQKDSGFGGVEGKASWTASDVIGCVMKQCTAVLQRHQSLPPADYVDDGNFRSLVTDVLNAKQFAKEKLRLWLLDDNQLVVFWSGYTLRDAHRLWLGLVRKRLRIARGDRASAADAALMLLKVKGRVRSCVTDINTDGETAFVEAGGDGWDEEDILALAQCGCDVRAVNGMGHSGLSQAAAYGYTSTLNAMLQVGADVSQYTASKRMGALFRASYNGHTSCVKVLIESKADVDATLADGSSCSYVAAEKGHCDVLQLLIGASAAFDVPDANGVTPLWRAAERGCLECVRVLICARANVGELSKDGKSALYASACNGHAEVVAELLSAGADAELTFQGMTAEAAAAAAGNAACAEILANARKAAA